MSSQQTPPLAYEHRARPYSPEARFVLQEDRVAVTQGSRRGDFAYRDIVLVRLLYKPRNTTNEGYQAKLYRRDRKTASFTNLSWKSLVDMDRQDAQYAMFLRTLIGNVVQANPSVVLQAGLPPWLFGCTAAAGLIAVGALVVVVSQSALNGGWPVALLTSALALYFGWWTFRYLSRNRPRSFLPDAIPADVLPPP